MALPQPAAPASQDRPGIRIDCRTTAETPPMQSTIHVYELRPRKDKRGTDLISDVLPFKPGFCIREIALRSNQRSQLQFNDL
jgi:hypothetical protein